MEAGASVLSPARLKERLVSSAQGTPWLPSWSKPAAIRGARAAVVLPGVFALGDQVIGKPQLTLFAAFGSFATLVLASFAGSWRDKLIAHAGLAVAGSVLLIIGTAVSSSTALAAIVTVPVTFAVFFAGAIGPNAASGVTGALLIYVLPAASQGTISMVPDRLAGWWLASVAGTTAVLLFPTPTAGDRLRGTARTSACALADWIQALLRGEPANDESRRSIDAKLQLFDVFDGTPFRPTGLAVPDQALSNGVELLEWCTSLLIDTASEHGDLCRALDNSRRLLEMCAIVLRESGELIAGGREPPDLERLDELRRQNIEALHALGSEDDDFYERSRASFHADAISLVVLALGVDAIVAARLAGPKWLADARRRWFGSAELAPPPKHGIGRVSDYAGFALSHASLRSVWFTNSVRGSLSLAAAVAVADLSNVQHAFWVVLGTLSVLRTNAASTGSTAVRALIGTALGFVVGGALLVAIGAGSAALWAALPIAVFAAAYSPGAAPFLLGQAAFTVTVAVLFNLLVPVGWSVGVVRIEDVALGCAVSLVVGGLFWPRGVASVVGDDLADAYRTGAAYLSAAVSWVSGVRSDQPDASPVMTAALRLDDALRAFLAEQGTKHVKKEELWRLVGGTLRLRLTGNAVARLPFAGRQSLGEGRDALASRTEALDQFYERLATQLGRSGRGAALALTAPDFGGDGLERTAHSRGLIWPCEYLDHLAEHLCDLVQPAAHIVEVRRRPWWR